MAVERVPGKTWASKALRLSASLLVAVIWISAAIFGAYILLFFGGSSSHGASDRWNGSLPALYNADNPAATIAIGLHFITGGVLLLLGPIQLFGSIRREAPAVHRWLGRAYGMAAFLAGLGGLGFILFKGTIGGLPMDVGFGLYGLMMVVVSALTYAHARSRRVEKHRTWAIRLFALTIGSWLYRMEYAFWFLAIGRLGHTSQFSGWFDHIMAVFFYLPNLLVAELFLQARRAEHHPGRQLLAAAVLLAAILFVTVATTYFTAHYWWPGIKSGVTGTPL